MFTHLLITQKLKNRMKSLKPKSTEPHEVMIELNEEVDYLVKRLVGLKAQDLLNTDNDYINAIYAHLPYEQQLAWDDYEVKEEETEWLAFSEFLNSKYKSALKKRTRVESLKEMKIDVEKVKVKCHIGNEEGHKSFKCPKNPKNMKDGKVTSSKVEVKSNEERVNLRRRILHVLVVKRFILSSPRSFPMPRLNLQTGFTTVQNFRNLM